MHSYTHTLYYIYYSGLTLGWVYLAMGVFIGSAVFPVASCVMWDRCTANGAIGGALGGQALALCTWLVYARAGYGGVNVPALGEENVMLAANVVGIVSSCVITTAVSLYEDEPPCDWANTTMAIPLVEQDEEATSGAVFTKEEHEEMDKAQRTIVIFGSGLSALLVIIWPALTIPAGVFSKPYWRFWVGLSMAWGLVSTVLMTVLPLWEARVAIARAVAYTFGGKAAVAASSERGMQGSAMEETSVGSDGHVTLLHAQGNAIHDGGSGTSSSSEGHYVAPGATGGVV
jgi:hypothetical protein